MSSNNDILFGSDYSVTARQQYVMDAIEKSNDSIIRACSKCDNGFVIVRNKKKSLLDAVYSSATECSCRIKAFQIAKLIEAGIPKHFIDKKDISLSIDVESEKVINLYIKQIEKVFEKSIGMLLLNAEVKNFNLSYARQLAAIKVLLNILSTKHTAHYIDMNRYFSLKFNLVRNYNQAISDFINEIETVDFLCIDNVKNVNITEYVRNNLYTLLSERVLHGKPTILITPFNLEGLINYLGSEIMNQIIPSMFKVVIKKYEGKEETFVNLKRKLQ